tara:strand:+ start:329 stop:538 length:210 start_codon:yes stop_codon:yes gene_type:complete
LKRPGINKNNLLPWFTQDHGALPASYLASCEKFFKSIKQQASSGKPQASSNKRLTAAGPCGIYRIIKEK